jgi:hypothetical protein
MKRITVKSGNKTLPDGVRREILRTHGAQVEIASMAGVRRAYVCDVLGGRKNCSDKLWAAISEWLDMPRGGNGPREMAKAEMAAIGEAS